MFTKVRLSDFKSFHGSNSVDLRRISVFVGPNGSGKSSVLQALQLWRQSMDSNHIQTEGPSVDLGQPSDLQSPRASGPTFIGFDVRRSQFLPMLANTKRRTSATANVELGASIGTPANMELKISYKSFKLAMSRQGDSLDIQPSLFEQEPNSVGFAHSGAGIADPLHIRSTGGPQGESLRAEIQTLLSMARDELSGVRLVPALRGFGHSSYPLRGESNDFAASPDVRQNADLLSGSLIYNDGLRDQVSGWLNVVTGITLDRIIRSANNSAFASPGLIRSLGASQSSRVAPTNEGFGSNQLLFLLAQTATAPSQGTVLIEEPEINLHPHSQFKLGCLLAEHAIQSGKQLLITTHSERFLASLLW